eukprot:TRINITY_DN2651_c0_g1_i1.p1 TRINITY_DN2651_c0_g1~~TRINITY_DN2651_c0_g1_i1.p1  ORF type:complete len:388 (+),score=41.41 TRINITY_DN2651_c0_g1_i1:61-1224(+)
MISVCLLVASLLLGCHGRRARQVDPGARGPVGPAAGPQGVRPSARQVGGAVGGQAGRRLVDVSHVLAKDSNKSHYCCCNGGKCRVHEHDVLSRWSPVDGCSTYGYGKKEKKHCVVDLEQAARLYNRLGLLGAQFCSEMSVGSTFNEAYIRSGSLNEKLKPTCKHEGYVPVSTSSCVAELGPNGFQGVWDPLPRCEAKSEKVHVYLLAYGLIPLPLLPPSLKVHHSATLICPQRGDPKQIPESEAAGRTKYVELFRKFDCREWSFPDFRGIVMNPPGEYLSSSTIRVRYVGSFKNSQATDSHFMDPYKKNAERLGFREHTYNRMEHNCNSFSIAMLGMLGKDAVEVMGCESPKRSSLRCIAVENRNMPGNKRKDLDGWIAIQDKILKA